MKVSRATAQRRKEEVKDACARLRLCVGKLVAIAIALSFLAMSLPIAGASPDTSMACCVGKTAGHCDSGLAAKKPPQPKEPMCGLHNAEAEDDGITIVAEPAHSESHKASESSSTSAAAESASLSQPCQMDCGACATGSTRQQKRERGIANPSTQHSLPLTIASKFEIPPFCFSSNKDWEQTSPRGPPSPRS